MKQQHKGQQMEKLDKKLVITFERIDGTNVGVTVKGDRSILWADTVKKAIPAVIKSLEEEEEESTIKDSKEQCLRALANLADKSYEQIIKELEAMDGGANPENITKLSIKYMHDFLNKKDSSDKKKKAKKQKNV